MSDGESFYLILALFYLFDCLKTVPTGAHLFQAGLRASKPWSPRPELFRLASLKKTVFLGSVLPWPGLYLTPGQTVLNGPHSTIHSVRRKVRFLSRATGGLRAISLLVFLYYFAVLPLIYRSYNGQGTLVLLAIAYGILLLWVTAAQFYLLHRRLLPTMRGERLKHTLYTALLPWHAMHCTYEILSPYTLGWSKPAVLAAYFGDWKNRTAIQTLWRLAHFHPAPPYDREELAILIAKLNEDPSHWLTAPKHDSSSSFYCPCCHQAYTKGTDTCTDCGGTPLLPW